MPTDKIYVLGPEGTYSDHAARRLNDFLVRSRQAAGAEISYTRSIPEALELASQDASARAVAPIENSETGAVVATQDHLAKRGLVIEWEINVRIRFTLISDCELDGVKQLFVHPVALEQCDAFTAKHLRNAEVTFTRSNVDSAMRWASAAVADQAAAIVPWDYQPARPARVEIHDVQNSERNTTRFVVVRSGGGFTGDFSRAKTSLLIEPD
jgi:prephenate dehydratase